MSDKLKKNVETYNSRSENNEKRFYTTFCNFPIPSWTTFFSRTFKSGISHAGIYIGDNKFISASSSKGIKIDSLNGGYWGPKYTGAKRVLK